MRKIEGYFLVIIAGVLYGTIPIFATLLTNRHISTLEQIVVRLSLALAVIALYFGFAQAKSLRIKARDYLHFCWFGLVGIALFFSAYMSAAVLTGVTVAVLLLYTQPIYTLIISRFFLKRKVHPSGLISIALSLAGIAVMFRIWAMEFRTFSIGHVFGLLAGLIYSIYIVFMNKFSPRYGSPVCTFWSFAFGLLWMIPIWYIMNRVFPTASVSALNVHIDAVSGLILAGFTVATLLAYLLFNQGLKTVEPHRAGVLILSEPLAAIILGVFILDQKLVLTDILGGLLILTAFFIIKKSNV